MMLDLTDDETRALVQLLRHPIDFDPVAYRNSGQQTIPTAKIIADVQKSFRLWSASFLKKGA